MRKVLLCSMLLAGCHDYAALSAGYDKTLAAPDAATSTDGAAGSDLAQAKGDLATSAPPDFAVSSSADSSVVGDMQTANDLATSGDAAMCAKKAQACGADSDCCPTLHCAVSANVCQ